VQLPLQDHDLVSQGQDFGVFGAVARGQQPQHRQGAVALADPGMR
jgi:hypothetical protein